MAHLVEHLTLSCQVMISAEGTSLESGSAFSKESPGNSLPLPLPLLPAFLLAL